MSTLYKKQEKKLLNLIDEDLNDNFAELGCYVAGGAITSIFTNKDVNDLDIYFRNIESLIAFVENMFGEMNKPKFNIMDLSPYTLIYQGHTKKSILCQTSGGQEVQLIHDRFYETPQDIFGNFDFHLNMGCYDYKEGVFVLSDKFLVDNCQKVMTVNPKTSFPIISQLRIDKYKQRGYSINRKEFILLACATSKLNFQSWKDVKHAIGGLYGYNIDDVFDESVEFSYESLFEQLFELEANDGRFKGLDSTNSCEELVHFIKSCHGLAEPIEKVAPQAPCMVYPTKNL